MPSLLSDDSDDDRAIPSHSCGVSASDSECDSESDLGEDESTVIMTPSDDEGECILADIDISNPPLHSVWEQYSSPFPLLQADAPPVSLPAAADLAIHELCLP